MDQVTLAILGAALVAVLAACGFAFWRGRMTGRTEAARATLQADKRRADEIRRDVAKVRARVRADQRPVDDRLRDLGRLRD